MPGNGIVLLTPEFLNKQYFMAQFKRSASAVWRGNGPDGSGVLNGPSGLLSDTPYSAAKRFQNEDGKAGTNPEELIAAVLLCQTMGRGPALKRQRQFIGKLMRDVDEAQVVRILEGNRTYIPPVVVDHSVADVLIRGGDPALQRLIARYPALDRNRLRQWARAAAKPGAHDRNAKLITAYLDELGVDSV